MEVVKKRGPEKNPKDRARLQRMEKQMHEITSSNRFRDALEEVGIDPKAMAELKANPRAHFGKKGIKFPDEVEVGYKEESPGCIWYAFSWWCYREYHYYCWVC